MYEFHHKLQNDLRLKTLQNQEISRKFVKYFKLLASTQPPNHFPRRHVLTVIPENLKK